MKKLFLLKIILVVIVTVSLAAFFKSSYDNDDSTLDFLSGCNNLLSACFLLILLPSIGVSYINIDNFTYPESLVSYLSSKEKSPPALIF